MSFTIGGKKYLILKGGSLWRLNAVSGLGSSNAKIDIHPVWWFPWNWLVIPAEIAMEMIRNSKKHG